MAREHDDAATEARLGSDGEQRRRSRSNRSRADRPTLGAVLLGLGAAVLGWRAVAATTLGPAASVTMLELAAVALPVLGLGFAVVALVRPSRATAVGAAGVAIALGTVTAMLVSPGPVLYPWLLVSGLLVAGAGGLSCVVWGGSTDRPRLQRGRGFRLGRAALVGGLVVLLAFNAAPAVAGETFPASMSENGGFVVHQDTLSAGSYSYAAACPAPDDGAWGEPCYDTPIDSSTKDNVPYTARQRLDSTADAAVVISGFRISKDFGGMDSHFQISADEAIAETDGGRSAIDTYVSEVRVENMTARLDLAFTGAGIKADTVSTWTCRPGNESGFGSLNDVRLGFDVDPRVTGGKDVSLLSHQLGSSKTTLTDFELTVEDGQAERVQADAAPTSPPATCN